MKSLKAESTFIYVTKNKKKEPKPQPSVAKPDHTRSAAKGPEIQSQTAARDTETYRQLSAPPTARRPQPEQEQPTRDWSALFANKDPRSPRDPEKLFKKTDQRLKMLEDIEKKLSHSNKNDTLSDLLSQFVDNGKVSDLNGIW